MLAKSSIEETLNGLLDAKADSLCGAGKYDGSPERVDTRSGSYSRRLETKEGDVTLKVPRLRSLPFEKQIFLANVSLKKMADVAPMLKAIHAQKD